VYLHIYPCHLTLGTSLDNRFMFKCQTNGPLLGSFRPSYVVLMIECPLLCGYRGERERPDTTAGDGSHWFLSDMFKFAIIIRLHLSIERMMFHIAIFFDTWISWMLL